MKTRIIKLISVLLCAIMLISVLAACTDENPETTETPSSAQTEGESTEPSAEEITTEEVTTEAPTEAATTEEITTEAPTEAATTEEVTTEAPTEAATTEEITTEAPTEAVTTEEITTEISGEETTAENATDEETTEEETTEEETTVPVCGNVHEYQNDATDHWKDACTDCGYEGEEKSAHTYENGICSTCGYEPECGLKHAYWQHNADGHYRDACEFCGGGAVESRAHECDMLDGVYCCTICKYEPECKGEHWVKVPEGHSQPACDKCDFEGDELMDAPHYCIVGEDGSYVCDICGFVPECGGAHTLANDDPEAHYTLACALCGAEEGDKFPHAYSDDDEFKCTECGYDPECGNVHEYTYDENGHSMEKCEHCLAQAIEGAAHVYCDEIKEGIHIAKCICGLTKSFSIPESVEIYHSAIVVDNTGIAGYQGSIDKKYISAEGEEYVRFDNLTFTDAKASSWPWVRLNVINDSEGIDGVRYMVFKYRLGKDNCAPDGSANTTTYMSCFVSSADMPGKMPPATDTLNVDVKQDGEWHTVVVDLCRLGNNITVDPETGLATLKLLQFQPMLSQWKKDANDESVAVSAWSEDSFFDIAYVAVCDEYSDLKEVIDQDTYTYRVSTADTNNYVFKTSEIGDTAPTEAPAN